MSRKALFCNSIQNNLHDQVLYLKVKDAGGGGVYFPLYLWEISGTIHSMIPENTVLEALQENTIISVPTPFSLADLEKLASLIKIVPSAIRNTKAQKSPVMNVYPISTIRGNLSTNRINIIVNSLLYHAAFPIMKTFSLNENVDLLKVANHLNIPALMNAVAHFIADSTFPQVNTEIMKQNLSKPLERILLDAVKSSVPVLPDELSLRISKYVYLRKIGVSENTISDLIGMNGMPQPSTGGMPKGAMNLTLNNRGLTSFSGLDLIRNTQVDALWLNDNFILGSDIDLDYPEDPFLGLQNVSGIYLYGNHITKLPSNFFYREGRVRFNDVSIHNNLLVGNEEDFVTRFFPEFHQVLKPPLIEYDPQKPQSYYLTHNLHHSTSCSCVNRPGYWFI